MMAGKAAYARNGWKDAKQYFIDLYNNTNCPADLRFQAFFAYGDTLANEGKPENYEETMKEVMRVFGRISRDYSTNKLAALALGQKACYALQWAQTSAQYDVVTNAFLEVITNAQADARGTNIATIGLGIVLQRMGQQHPEQGREFREQALDQYVTVFLNEEQPEIFWTKFAGMRAGSLAYDMHEWQKAMKIYQRLQKMLPEPLPSLQNRIQDCERNLVRVSRE
jgi:hypothetical protein